MENPYVVLFITLNHISIFPCQKRFFQQKIMHVASSKNLINMVDKAHKSKHRMLLQIFNLFTKTTLDCILAQMKPKTSPSTLWKFIPRTLLLLINIEVFSMTGFQSMIKGFPIRAFSQTFHLFWGSLWTSRLLEWDGSELRHRTMLLFQKINLDRFVKNKLFVSKMQLKQSQDRQDGIS